MFLSGMLQHLLHHIFQRICTFNGLQNRLSFQFGQRCCDNDSFIIDLPHQLHALLQPLCTDFIRSGQQYGPRVFDLIDKKFTEILDIHFRFRSIHHRYRTVHMNIRLNRHILHRPQHIRQLSHTGRLDQNTLRRISLDHFFQGSTEISHKRTANTSGIHLLDLNPRFFQKTSVNADLAEFILDQHRPAAFQCFL